MKERIDSTVRHLAPINIVATVEGGLMPVQIVPEASVLLKRRRVINNIFGDYSRKRVNKYGILSIATVLNNPSRMLPN